MKSKIVSCKFVKTWSGEKGTIYYHDVEFEDGNKGSAGLGSEEPAQYAVGTEHEYELTPNGSYAAKIRFANKNSTGGGFKKQQGSNAGFALSYAKDLTIASWTREDKNTHLSTSQMFTLAEKIFEWMEARKS